jgi:hypothetical protein
MTPRCAGGAVSSLQTGTFADQTESAWREWWDLDNANYAVWVRRDACTSSAVPGTDDGQDIARAATTSYQLGVSTLWTDCAFLGTPYYDQIDVDVWTGGVNSVSECAHGQQTFNGTWLHELGHGYGFGHFDDWPSTMNTSDMDVTSCTSTRLARPSSDAQQGMDFLYGIAAAYDYGSTPVIQPGGSILVDPLELPASLTTYPLNTNTSRSVTLDMTRMNMRDAWLNATVNYRIVLSTDRVWSADDVFVADQSVNWGLFAGAIYRHQPTVSFIPTVVLSPGQTKCFLIKWDAWGGTPVTEAREDDNVMDMDICVKRSTT